MSKHGNVSKHTPGPWSFEKSGLINGRDGKLVAEAFGDSMRGNQPNARLIASAPELLEALKDMAAWSECCIKVMEMDGNKTLATGLEMRRRIALKVIAKATGKP